MDIEAYQARLFSPVKKVTERGELLRFFADKTNRSIKFIGIRLSYLSVEQLYALKSQWTDRENRDGYTTAIKWWWWFTKTHVDKPN